MPVLQTSFNRTTGVATVQLQGDAVPAGSVPVGTFSHPDPVYPESVVMYHGVRELLGKRSHANPANPALYPNNITNMRDIKIIYDGVIEPSGVTVVPTAASIIVGATRQLVPTVAPAQATDKTVRYVSSDVTKATVSTSGLVTGVAAGTANIVITTNVGNKTTTCAITVTAT